MDPQQQQHLAGVAAGLMGVFLFFGLAVAAFVIFLFWRILTKAGLSGPLALLVLVPGIGWIIVLCILAFSDWNVTSVAAAPYYPPVYPPPAPPQA
jgi:uncharacterized membrane protein YhaH (DUF805 family)